MKKILDNIFVEEDKQKNTVNIQKILCAVEQTLKPVLTDNGLNINKIQSLHINISVSDDNHGYRVITYLEQD